MLRRARRRRRRPVIRAEQTSGFSFTGWRNSGTADLDGGQRGRLGGRRPPSFLIGRRLYRPAGAEPEGCGAGRMRRWEGYAVTADLLARAQAGDGDAFAQLVEPYRRELQVHCYRFLGSAQDAEDALQDTWLSAWQGLAGFEGRASVRT